MHLAPVLLAERTIRPASRLRLITLLLLLGDNSGFHVQLLSTTLLSMFQRRATAMLPVFKHPGVKRMCAVHVNI